MDGSLIAAWLVATGGWSSPFYVLWYVSIVAVAFRYSTRETLAASLLCAVAYAAIAFVDVGVPDLASLSVRVGYIGLVAAIAVGLSREVAEQTEARVAMQQLAERAREAKARFRRLLEAAPDAIDPRRRRAPDPREHPSRSPVRGKARRTRRARDRRAGARPLRGDGHWTARERRSRHDRGPRAPRRRRARVRRGVPGADGHRRGPVVDRDPPRRDQATPR